MRQQPTDHRVACRGVGWRTLVTIACTASLALTACIWSTDEPYLTGGDLTPLEVTGTIPTTNSSEANAFPLDGELVFLFDHRVDPLGVTSETFLLTSGSLEIPSARRVDWLACSVSLRPDDLLLPLQTYTVTASGLRGVGSGSLAGPETFTVTTGDATAGSHSPPHPSLAEITDEIFTPRCGSCHGAFRPFAGLDLSSEATAAEGLTRRESVLREGRILVVPGSHASSYLMRKLLNLPGIFGDPMPPDSPWPNNRECGTQDSDLRRIAAWIDSLSTEDGSPD